MRLLLLLLACGGADALVVVTVNASTQLDGVRSLHATAVAGARSTTFEVSPVDGGSFSVPPPRTFGVEVPEAFVGPFSIDLVALDEKGSPLAGGAGSTTSSAGERSDLTITLGAARDGGP